MTYTYIYIYIYTYTLHCYTNKITIIHNNYPPPHLNYDAPHAISFSINKVKKNHFKFPNSKKQTTHQLISLFHALHHVYVNTDCNADTKQPHQSPIQPKIVNCISEHFNISLEEKLIEINILLKFDKS